jgi:methionyl-tRNA formyltransferase
LRLVVVAEESAGVQVLHGLVGLEHPPEITAVLTTIGAAAGRRAIVQEAAGRLGFEAWPAELVRSAPLAKRLRDAQVDLLLNVHSLFRLHPEVVAAAQIGSFNLHPGPLPDYAGLNVPSWAVYNGEQAHAVTLHWMDEGIDTGPIAWLDRFPLSETDTGLSVSGKCVRRGVPLVMKLVATAERDAAAIPRIEQDLSRRRYFSSGPPEQGRIDWSAPSADILRFVRAADYMPFPSPWGHPQAVLYGRRVGIARAAPTGISADQPPGTVREVTDAGLLVATGDEVIAVEKVWLEGRYLKGTELFAG